MPTIDELKEQESTPTPLFLFECRLRTGAVERWSTHRVTFEGEEYAARLLRHNLFDLRASSEDGFDGTAKLSVTLANADSRYSQIERAAGFKGAALTVRFVFFDLEAGTAASEARVVFRGKGNAPDEVTEASARVTFNNRLNLQRIVLPEVRIGRRCPWLFPATAAQRSEALDGGALGQYSALYRCGYSPDQGGVGNLNGASPYTSCDYTRASCVARGMFDKDDQDRVTRRFGGVEFVPAQILVRSYGEKGSHLSPVVDNEARYNDTVPLVYGTAWYQPPVVFGRNDGNLTFLEVLLGMGEIEGVVKVLVNDIEIPEGIDGRNMTATGWFNVISRGRREGAFNPSFADGAGHPLGDPYGSMALLNIAVPNRISTGQTLPKVQVMVRGMRLEQFDPEGVSMGPGFTNNPAWVLLDVLRRSGWDLSEVDLASFAETAAYCGEPIPTTDLFGNPAVTPRFQCNLVVARTPQRGRDRERGPPGIGPYADLRVDRAVDAARGELDGHAAGEQACGQQQHGDAGGGLAGVRVQRRVGGLLRHPGTAQWGADHPGVFTERERSLQPALGRVPGRIQRLSAGQSIAGRSGRCDRHGPRGERGLCRAGPPQLRSSHPPVATATGAIDPGKPVCGV